LAVLWFFGPPAGAQTKEGQKLRVGTYDARAVAVAFAHSEMNREQLKEKMQELKDAEAKQDTKRVKELKTWGESHQWLLHMQGFAGAPVEDILGKMKDKVASVATASRVDVVTRKFDYSASAVEVVDVTDEIVKLFKPDEKTLKTIRELRRRPAMDMADLEQALKEHHH
jgi:hypothetical protein